jgi:hypothetical protein
MRDLADLFGALVEVVALHDSMRLERRRTRHRVAAKGRTQPPRCGASTIAALPVTAASGIPAASDFAITTRSGSTPLCSIGEPAPGAAEAGLHLVGDQHDAVLVAQLRAPCADIRRKRG